ncbi:hypothetical protein PhCBS80983_g04497 [Powellomyces hirtus]|uniref:Uncharacterized protein n=1 Tax=Powellomyces hirtus TaxID=109895 RepID=A0A507DYG1_9FUNG|nr:hypothetical protein PhCBS80983_g04497 [Powellomyces hirtus]
MYEAVFFDIGGVCVHSPLQGIRKFELTKGLPENYLNVAIQSRGEDGAFQKLERGELSLAVFYPLFGQECSHPSNVQAYEKYLKSKGKPFAKIPQVTIDGKELFTFMMQEAMKPNQLVLNAVQKLKDSGRLKIAALTNNFQFEESEETAFGKPPMQVMSLFGEHYIESSIVGLRKPDPRFFQYACDKLGVAPGNAIMVDDIGPNLKAAKELGMATIRVIVGKSKEAIKQLEQLVEIPLLDDIDTPTSAPLETPPFVTGAHEVFFAPTDDILAHCQVYPSMALATTTGLMNTASLRTVGGLAEDDALADRAIEIPEIHILDSRTISKRIHGLFPASAASDSNSSIQAVELADDTYRQRHRKHEYAEKRMRNREKEYVRHQLYKRRMMGATAHGGQGPGGFMATHPRRRGLHDNGVSAVTTPKVYLTSTYILFRPPSDGVLLEQDESPVVATSHSAMTQKPTTKVNTALARRRSRGPMAFGYPLVVFPAKAFERCDSLIQVLREHNKI